MTVSIDTTIFHDVTNKMAVLKEYLEILDNKIKNMNAGGDEELFGHWKMLKNNCTEVINALKKYERYPG